MLNSPENSRLESIFGEARELVREQRQAYLDRACGDDVALRGRIESLLEAEGHCATEMLRRAAGLDYSAPAESLPIELDRYLLEERIGEGSFGVVYRASQRIPVKRSVAIKLLRPGFDSAEVIGRFNSERQALARMDHPNVAKILDGGSTNTGRPYFVMEYVAGIPITRFADERKLSIEARLQLFIQACEAIAHAHTKAIIHRDIKASNVLAYERDGTLTVKVIDFGIAKAITSDRLSDMTCTAQGAPIGTFAYMSPEQAMGSPDIDTRTDVYSLGVLLYELLIGAKPFDQQTLARAPEHEIRRLIGESDPPSPSTRLRTLGESGASIAAVRQMKLDALTRELRNELEWIPLMAMRKEPDRRYGSVHEFALDVRNYLQRRPLAAGPETRRYRLRKYLRRNRGRVAAAAMLVLVLLIGITGTSWGMWRAIRAERSATALAQSEREQRRLAQQSERSANVQLITAQNARADSLLATDFVEPAFDLLLRADTLARKISVPNLQGELLLTSLRLRIPSAVYADTSIQSSAQHIRLLPDGRTLLNNDDREIIFFDLLTGLVRRRLPGHDVRVNDVAVSPDGKMLASCDDGGTVILWSYPDGVAIHKLKLVNGQLFSVGFSPRDPLLIVTTKFGLIAIDTRDPASVRSRDVGTTVQSVDFTPDGSLILISGDGGKWRRLSADNLAEELVSPVPDPNIRTIACDASGSIVFMGTDKGVRRCDLATGQQLSFYPCPAAVRALAISPSSRVVAASCADRTIRLFDISSGRLLRAFLDHFESAKGLIFSPDESALICGTLGSKPGAGGIRAWSLNPPEYPSTLGSVVEVEHNGGGIIALSSDSRLALVPNSDQSASLWDLATGLCLAKLGGHHGALRFTGFGGDPARFHSLGDDGELIVWDLSTLSPVSRRKLSIQNPSAFGIAANRPIYAVSSRGGPLEVRDASTDHILETYPAAPNAPIYTSAEFSRDGSTILGNTNTKARIFRRNGGAELFAYAGATYMVAVLNSENSGFLSGEPTGSIARRKFPNSSSITMSRHVGPVASVAASADGKLLASGGEDGMIALSIPSTLELLAVFRGLPGTIDQLAFSPDSNHLLAIADKRLFLIDLRAGGIELANRDRLDLARKRLKAIPGDPQALLTLGLHYAQCYADSWAIELLTQARALGADVPSLPLARAYWRRSQHESARQEFQRASERNEAPEYYIRLCIIAIQSPFAAETPAR